MSVGKIWGQQIAGPVLAFVSIAMIVSVPFVSDPVVATRIVKAGAWITGICALLMVFAAQYQLWSQERDQLEHERAARQAAEARNSRPELNGEAYSFERRRFSGSSSEPTYFSELQFQVTLSNHRPVTTNVQQILVDGSLLNPPVKFSECEIPDIRLEQGIARSFTVTGSAEVAGVRPSREQEGINLQPLKITVVDGFGNPHAIPAKDGERLVL